METIFNRYVLTTAALIAAAAGLIALDLTRRLEARAVLYRAAAPVFRVSALWREVDRGEEERAVLAARLAERSLLVGRAEELKRENDALRASLKLAVEIPYELTYARVLDRTPERWVRSITAAGGARAGVAAGMPVIGEDGLVGVVSRVTAGAAEVELISSERLRLAAVHAPSGEAATYYSDAGGGGHLDYLPRTTDLRVGDMVVTSGTSRLYPPGIVIGYVRGFRLPYDSMFAEVDVAPAQDLNRLESVLIVKWRAAKE